MEIQTGFKTRYFFPGVLQTLHLPSSKSIDGISDPVCRWAIVRGINNNTRVRTASGDTICTSRPSPCPRFSRVVLSQTTTASCHLGGSLVARFISWMSSVETRLTDTHAPSRDRPSGSQNDVSARGKME